ncbi:MAG: MobC family plasmid mobilization relaxosome protein [Oscillospiraceae bacterium]
MQKRLRTKQIVIRMTEEEYEQIKNKIEQSKMTQQEYLIRACTDKKIIVVEGIRELTVELKRIGNNLNQIARACNEGRGNCKEEVHEIEKELGGVWQLLRRLAQGRV